MRLARTIGILIALWVAACPASVRTGLDRIDAYESLLTHKRIGIIANHTSYNREGEYIVDVLGGMGDARVVALFSPEHGLRGGKEAGEKIDNQVDPVYNLPVHSLYGRTTKPTPEMLADVDVLVFCIQDVGARFYTYLYTMSLAMEAAAECGKRFVVLDRPNPINGLRTEGPVLEPEFASFVGLYPIPVRYGMTVGELARMINDEGWLTGGVRADLTVVPMKGWRRRMWHDQTGLRFIRPSPNMPDLETAALYPGLCLLEGTNVSEGRGTPMPFRQFGTPWIDSEALVSSLRKLNLPGVEFETASFVPEASKYNGRTCHGVRIVLTDRDALQPFWTGVSIVDQLYRMYPDQFEWKAGHFDRLCGTDAVRKAIIARSPIEKLRATWQAECRAFRRTRRKYLLYPD